MTDSNNHHDDDNPVIDARDLPRPDADKGREPRLLESRKGTRMMSLAALVERISIAFIDEHGRKESAAYREATTETERLKLVRDIANYVFAIESVHLSPEEQANVIRRAYAELFSYGPLDDLFRDSRITTIAIEGTDKIAVRYGHGDFTTLDPVFEDLTHLRDIIDRLLIEGGAELRPDEPIIEAGILFEGRPISINIAAPPVTIQLTADIRVHPEELPTFDALVSADVLTQQAVTLLWAIAQSPHGFAIVGDTESGKTTLLAILAQYIPNPASIIAVERAGELRLPKGAERLVVQWPLHERPGVNLQGRVNEALEKQPACLLLDEVRADEAAAVAPLLTRDDAPRQIWSFRGPSVAKRIRSALEMVARRADPYESDAAVVALYRRLPFVIVTKRAQGKIQVRSIAEWQFPPNSDYPDFVELMAMDWEGLALTGKQPAHELTLPDNFWD